MQHELNGKTILLARVPETAHAFRAGRAEAHHNCWHFCIRDHTGFQLQGGFMDLYHKKEPLVFFATTDNITEQQAAELVEETDHTKGLYVDYTRECSGFVAPSDSLRSWLNANGISGNQAVFLKANVQGLLCR